MHGMEKVKFVIFQTKWSE